MYKLLLSLVYGIQFLQASTIYSEIWQSGCKDDIKKFCKLGLDQVNSKIFKVYDCLNDNFNDLAPLCLVHIAATSLIDKSIPVGYVGWEQTCSDTGDIGRFCPFLDVDNTFQCLLQNQYLNKNCEIAVYKQSIKFVEPPEVSENPSTPSPPPFSGPNGPPPPPNGPPFSGPNVPPPPNGPPPFSGPNGQPSFPGPPPNGQPSFPPPSGPPPNGQPSFPPPPNSQPSFPPPPPNGQPSFPPPPNGQPPLPRGPPTPPQNGQYPSMVPFQGSNPNFSPINSDNNPYAPTVSSTNKSIDWKIVCSEMGDIQQFCPRLNEVNTQICLLNSPGISNLCRNNISLDLTKNPSVAKPISSKPTSQATNKPEVSEPVVPSTNSNKPVAPTPSTTVLEPVEPVADAAPLPPPITSKPNDRIPSAIQEPDWFSVCVATGDIIRFCPNLDRQTTFKCLVNFEAKSKACNNAVLKFDAQTPADNASVDNVEEGETDSSTVKEINLSINPDENKPKWYIICASTGDIAKFCPDLDKASTYDCLFKSFGVQNDCVMEVLKSAGKETSEKEQANTNVIVSNLEESKQPEIENTNSVIVKVEKDTHVNTQSNTPENWVSSYQNDDLNWSAICTNTEDIQRFCSNLNKPGTFQCLLDFNGVSEECKTAIRKRSEQYKSSFKRPQTEINAPENTETFVAVNTAPVLDWFETCTRTSDVESYCSDLDRSDSFYCLFDSPDLKNECKIAVQKRAEKFGFFSANEESEKDTVQLSTGLDWFGTCFGTGDIYRSCLNLDRSGTFYCLYESENLKNECRVSIDQRAKKFGFRPVEKTKEQIKPIKTADWFDACLSTSDIPRFCPNLPRQDTFYCLHDTPGIHSDCKYAIDERDRSNNVAVQKPNNSSIGQESKGGDWFEICDSTGDVGRYCPSLSRSNTFNCLTGALRAHGDCKLAIKERRTVKNNPESSQTLTQQNMDWFSICEATGDINRFCPKLSRTDTFYCLYDANDVQSTCKISVQKRAEETT